MNQALIQIERRAEPQARPGDSRDWPVALVSMPFMNAQSPSIQIGLLKAIAEEHGFPTTTLHLNLDFASQIGSETYLHLCRSQAVLADEWLFSPAALGEEAPDMAGEFLEKKEKELKPFFEECGLTLEEFRAFRDEAVPRFLDHLLETIAWREFRVIGFTSTFAQTLASFALARRLKSEYPEIITLFGGANFEDEMGLEWARAMDCIDYVVIGEGDQAFPEFLGALRDGSDPAEVPGVVCRRDGAVTPLKPRGLFEALDTSPVPDYAEFFTRSRQLGLASQAELRRARIPYESARGCWWGAKHHCTFCGLNKNGMAFRSKSPEKVLEELAVLSRRHRSFEFFAVDNILDIKYLTEFFLRVVAEKRDYRFFYEVKANLTRAQIKTLHEGGVRCIQPGIESLSSNLLQLMRKGVTAAQNVNLLRWAHYYGMDILWNLLYGFPGESLIDYEEQTALLPQLVHLPPPMNTGSRISMHRFSPIFADRKTFPARSVKPAEYLKYLYPKRVDLNRVAYYFDYELEQTLPEESFEAMRAQASAWQEAWKGSRRPRLTFNYSPGILEIEDRRNPDAPRAISTTEPLASLYSACSDQPHAATWLQKSLGLDWSVQRIEAGLAKFCSEGLMMRDGNKFLSLALPASNWR